MNTPRISASSYSNTAPLVWSFLYGRGRGSVELILDNAPARSAELLTQGRVDAALVPVIASQFIDGVRVVPGVCVGAKESVRSVCIVTNGQALDEVRSISLDVSSRTSVALTKIIFREFLGREPEWSDALPDINGMLAASDAALLIGDPALAISSGVAGGGQNHRVFDLVELWGEYTGLGFVFAMWMTLHERLSIDLAAARDEGLAHLDEIAANYSGDIGLTTEAMKDYLSDSISYSVSEKMEEGLRLYLDLAQKHCLTNERRPLRFIETS